MTIELLDRVRLSGTGCSEAHAKELLDKVDAVIEAVYAGSTTGDITIEVDPSSEMPAPPSGTIFTNQAQVDDYLLGQDSTAFRII